MNRFVLALTWCLFASTPAALLAAGADSESESSASPASTYEEAKKLIQAGNYDDAIPLLKSVVADDDQNADAYNLLGFSRRKLGQLDLALTHYRMALEIDPKHRGANEYIGEAYLELGQLENAKKHLGMLKKSCFFGCEEYDDLKEAIAKYETSRK